MAVTVSQSHTNFGAATKALVKGTPGIVFALFVENRNAAVRYFQLHNKATAPAAADVPALSFPVPAGTANNPGVLILDSAFLADSVAFSLGIGWAVSTTLATFTDGATAAEHSICLQFV